MLEYGLTEILLHVSVVLVIVLFAIMMGSKNKREIHYFSMGLVVLIFVWTFSLLLQWYAVSLYQYKGMFLMNCCFTAVGFTSVFIFYLGRAFASGTGIHKGYYALLVLPIINTIAIWTNEYHHWFFVAFSEKSSEMVRGPLMHAQAYTAYVLIAIGFFSLIRFSIKNSGFFSKQSIFILAGAIVPVTVDLAFVLNLVELSLSVESVSFAIMAMFIMFAIFKFDFLTTMPIALQTVVDHISDCYLVINEQHEVTDFNRTLVDNFKGKADVKRKMNAEAFLGKLESTNPNYPAMIFTSIGEATEQKKSIFFDLVLSWEGFEKTFAVEITPVFSEDRHRWTILLLKDITEQTKSFELIQSTQSRLAQSEHLASLGKIVGGIAHNLKTPIMSISGGLEGLYDLINEYNDSIGDADVVVQDHYEIAAEMREWVEKMKGYCAYMSDVITVVKGQAVQLTASSTDKFILKELLKRIDILMQHELKRFSCKLEVNCGVDENMEIKGEVNSLVQVFNNLITNAIESYEGKQGKIDFTISLNAGMVLFELQDYGSGIPEDVQQRLFKEMITTKAKHGTGLGLYMSASTITGRYGGRMWFKSAQGEGTTFYIAIPPVVSLM